MSIFYFMFEARPSDDNPEKDVYQGAFISCWVKADDIKSAYSKAENFLNNDEGWEIVEVEDQFVVTRDFYHENDPDDEDSLQCFDEAVETGISDILYCWTDDK
ncbi:hypothetical protein [Sporolactobacillus laevolacticus]|uniref:Uncharacterized protein n=1 Tax=Sporolactobacillus laevolacticus DSM 442 TaxID=1395513 RepID=V6J5U2_9BACL|nr:hypothetical protein [Sporolactobacillus laevolacticus]EST12134.1 hypothetical protein P343_08595 [Sporolactobacillus laevolacticus DSM 442]